MPVMWHLDEHGLLHVTGAGRVTDAEYLEAHGGFIAATADQVGPRRSIADWAGVTEMQVTPNGIRTSVGITGDSLRPVSPPPAPLDHRIALVAVTPVVFGFCRMWQTLMSDVGVKCEIFASRDEALAWLAG